MSSFGKILVANRGEIAVRVIRALREMGIASVAVFSEADRRALHVQMADEAVPIGPAASSESYLSIDRILDAARLTGSGFLKHMVRNIVGVLLEVGKGNLDCSNLRGRLQPGSGIRPGPAVPASGLFLVSVSYE